MVKRPQSYKQGNFVPNWSAQVVDYKVGVQTVLDGRIVCFGYSARVLLVSDYTISLKCDM